MADQARHDPIAWRLATEYPATNISGVTLLSFADELMAQDAGTRIEVLTEQPGMTSQAIIREAAAGLLSGGDVYASALSGIDPVFAIPALPFHTRSTAQSRALLERCMPLYTRAFERLGHRFLFATAWPATGLWSDRPIRDCETLLALKLRTNDPGSAQVFRDIGMAADFMPFAEAVQRLRAGQLNAVLTSGDGGAGQKLWDYLRYFTPLGYAFPYSFAFTSERAMAKLSVQQAEQVEAAAARVQALQDDRLAARIAANFRRMTENGVDIARRTPDDVAAMLERAGRSHTALWYRTLPDDARALFGNE